MTPFLTGHRGFIGKHLQRALMERYGSVGCYAGDLEDDIVLHPMDQVFHLAYNTGGIGYVHTNPGQILSSNLGLDLSILRAAQLAGVKRLFYASSACIYPESHHRLTEVMDSPANPDGAIGWAKLTGEKLFMQSGIPEVRIGRLHSVYGPGCRIGAKEKVVTALCRKVIEAQGPSIEVWGNGQQIRSFTYISDAIDGIIRVMESDDPRPINIGSEEGVSIRELAQLLIDISGKRLYIDFCPEGPVGPEYRVPDSSRLLALGWEQKVQLREGLELTYQWVKKELGK